MSFDKNAQIKKKGGRKVIITLKINKMAEKKCLSYRTLFFQGHGLYNFIVTVA